MRKSHLPRVTGEIGGPGRRHGGLLGSGGSGWRPTRTSVSLRTSWAPHGDGSLLASQSLTSHSLTSDPRSWRCGRGTRHHGGQGGAVTSPAARPAEKAARLRRGRARGELSCAAVVCRWTSRTVSVQMRRGGVQGGDDQLDRLAFDDTRRRPPFGLRSRARWRRVGRAPVPAARPRCRPCRARACTATVRGCPSARRPRAW